MGTVHGRGRPWLDLVVDVGEPLQASELDDFLTARWGLHTRKAGRTLYVPNAHPPWPLREARVERLHGNLIAAAGFGDLAEREPCHVAFSPGVHTEFGLPLVADRRAPTTPGIGSPESR